jgi:hypothetical protein
MSLEEVIAKSIDVPNQDTKNVAAIIADYAKYDLIHERDIEYVKIDTKYNDEIFEAKDEDEDDPGVCDEFMFVKHYDAYYHLTKDGNTSITFVNGVPCDAAKRPIQHFIDNCDKYLFIIFSLLEIEKLFKKRPYVYKAYLIKAKFTTYESFINRYHIEIKKWYNLSKPYSRVENQLAHYFGYRVVIKYNGIFIYANTEDALDKEFCLETYCRLRDIFDKIENKWY